MLATLTFSPAIASATAPARGYEIVSPYNKGGADVGVGAFGAGAALYSGAGADGNRMMFGIPNNPVGEAVRGAQYYATATRTADGWKTISAIPGPEPGVRVNYVMQNPVSGTFLSADASALSFAAGAPYVNDPLLPYNIDGSSAGVYLAHSGGSLQWLTKPVDSSADPQPGQYTSNTVSYAAGGSSDFSTAYFTHCGTLTANDAPRLGRSNFGFYVTHDGVVSNAGVLPDGSVDPDGAQPAGDAQPGCQGGSSFSLADPTDLGNQVSKDGSRAFFISPNATDASGLPSARPPQLYVYREGQSSLLVSRSLADPDVPTAAGVSGIAASYIRATPDGAHVIFRSTDKLTSNAPSGSATPLYYRFDVDSEQLTYLSGVTGTIRAISDDGRRVLYLSGGSVLLDDAGTTTTIHSAASGSVSSGDLVSPRVSADGNVWVFSSTRPLGTSPTHVSGTPEVYRYVVGGSSPTCISCVASGSPASTGAILDPWGPHGLGYDTNSGKPRRPSRGVSTDGSRVYFETADALVGEDTNGKRDVYGWEDGTLSLVSAGAGPRDSFLLDTSASGDDVFFATADGLVAGDQDGSYDVYDYRVGGGFSDAPSVIPCTGDACQGAVTGAPTLAAPTSPLVAPVTVGAQRGLKTKKEKKRTLRISRGKSTSSRVVLKVRTPGAGKLRASGRGLKKRSRTAKRSATYTIKSKLTKASQRTLARTGRLKVRVSVRFTPSTGKAVRKTVKLTIKRSVRSSKKGR